MAASIGMSRESPRRRVYRDSLAKPTGNFHFLRLGFVVTLVAVEGVDCCASQSMKPFDAEVDGESSARPFGERSGRALNAVRDFTWMHRQTAGIAALGHPPALHACQQTHPRDRWSRFYRQRPDLGAQPARPAKRPCGWRR